MSHKDLVSVTIVTYNSGRFIRRCLETTLAQNYPFKEIIVIDNGSSDGTQDILERFEDRCRIIYNDENTGFAAGQNQAISLSRGEWTLALNPDVLLFPDFIQNLVEAGKSHPDTGTVCGKLLAMDANFNLATPPILDSTGIFFTPTLRHLDRGSLEPDEGKFQTAQYVFGATGAAALYRRTMIDDISLNGEFFDNDFFAYREDADVAWRAQLLGWKCVYTPNATAYHVRSVRPENRQSVSSLINMHSVKNRFLMRVKNITADLYWRNFFSITIRDLVVVAACLIREWSSLQAFWLVKKYWKSLLAKRKWIMSRRRVSDEYLASWFQHTPTFKPFDQALQSISADVPVRK